MDQGIIRALATETQARIAADQALATSALGTNWTAPYRLVRDFGKIHLTGLATGTTYLVIPGLPGTAEVAATDGSADAAFDFDPTRYALTGKTTNMQLVCELLANGTAPGCSFTTAVALASSLSGTAAPRIAIGSAPSPAMSLTQTPSGASSKTINGTTDTAISAWSATFYVLTVTVSANMAAGSYVTLSAKLEVHNT